MNVREVLIRDAQALIDIIDAGGVEASRPEIERTLYMLYKAAVEADILFDALNSRIKFSYEKNVFLIWCSVDSEAKFDWIEFEHN